MEDGEVWGVWGEIEFMLFPPPTPDTLSMPHAPCPMPENSRYHFRCNRIHISARFSSFTIYDRQLGL
nr:hypothetical protein [Nostoc sp. CreGUA01]